MMNRQKPEGKRVRRSRTGLLLKKGGIRGICTLFGKVNEHHPSPYLLGGDFLLPSSFCLLPAHIKTTFFIFFLILTLPVANAQAQQNGNYQLAIQLMQQQQYEEALPILENLYRQSPETFAYFDRYLDCLIHLKRFEDAEEIARNQIRNNHSGDETSVKLAEIFHLRGNRDAALELWQETAKKNRNNIQMIYSIASSMTGRREFDAAIDLYRETQSVFSQETLFVNELANTYMQAGRFEEAVNEFYRLIIESPDQMGVVQQRLLSMRDQQLYEIAAFELEERLIDLDSSHLAYSQLYQLLTWLLLEVEEPQRALIFARQYESGTNHTVYSLFSLAHQLLSSGEFELAIDAYEYYLESDRGSIRTRAKDEIIAATIQWAQYIQQNNLELAEKRDSLYDRAYELSQSLIETTPGYDHIPRIYSNIIDLSLNHYKDLEKAEFWHKKMMENRLSSDGSYPLYAEGRIALFKKDFTTARHAFTRAHRTTESSNLAERSRYYLSLSDFFAGETEFAEIQLRSLERQHTSFYANDAIKLRMWIKNGQRADTTGSVLQAIGEGLYAIHIGEYNRALEFFEAILANPHHPFSDDLTVELSSALPGSYSNFILQLLDRQIPAQPWSPLRERMLWDRAIAIEQNLLREQTKTGSDTVALPAEEKFFRGDPQVVHTEENLIELLEEMLLEFPNGFYAPYVREKLQQTQPAI